MKPSKYIIAFPSGERTILFNCRTDTMVQIEPALCDLFEKHESQPEEIEKQAPEFYNYLVEKGFVVEDDFDETQSIIDIWKKEDEEGEMLRTTINPTLNCNLRCWYCYEEHQGKMVMSREVRDSIINYYKHQAQSKRYKHIAISFFGGEPLMMFKDVVRPMMEQLKEFESEDVKFSWHFTTNGTLLTPEMVEFFEPYNPSFQITLDGNRLVHNLVKHTEKRDNYTLTIDNIRMLLSKGLHVGIRFNYTHKTLATFIDVLDELSKFSDEEKKHCNISFHRVWQDTKPETPEMRETFNEVEKNFRESDFFVVGQTTNQMGRCYGDMENSVVFNYNGDIYKCTAREFDAQHCEGKLKTDGTIEYNKRNEARKAVRYGNKTCRECMIFALCHGGCSQAKLESSNPEGCIKGFSEEGKIQFVSRRIHDLHHFSLMSKECQCSGNNKSN